ncbi:MAG TPA: DUF1259 domain-containing protein [Labilithrix sp.]|nr:DUF1259 domain-containing protein [Labilithrix sp.]
MEDAAVHGPDVMGAFTPGKQGIAEGMVMGDLVLFEDEINAVISTLFESGLEVTALHNHFFFDTPKVYFMHVAGEGTVASLGSGVRAAIDRVAEIRKRPPKPQSTSGASGIPATNAIDGARSRPRSA